VTHVRIVFLGTGDFGGPTLRALLEAGHEVLRVISQPDRPAGRGQALRPTPMHALAETLRLPHLQADDVNTLPLDQTVGNADIGVVAAFGQKISPSILAALPRGCINLHGSLLPKYRGAAPYQRAILDGERTTGVTVFQLNERWDAGPIWARRETPIGDTETADELHDRLAVLGGPVVVETLRLMERGEARPLPQDPAEASRAPKLSKADGYVDWCEPAFRVVRRIHGLWSWPAAACEFVQGTGSHPVSPTPGIALPAARRERVLLARATLANEHQIPEQSHALPGEFLTNLTVQTGRGTIRLLEVKPAGGKLMSFEAFANGRQVKAGDRLERIT
jgi:methionyl-tRNA formyltransferase